MTQISSTPDLANLYESIQKDNSNSMDNFGYASSGMAMDISWRLGRREAGHGEAATTNLSNTVVGNKKRVGEHQLHENGASVFKAARVKHWKMQKKKLYLEKKERSQPILNYNYYPWFEKSPGLCLKIFKWLNNGE